MNIRKIFTELFQKPAGRLLLFLVAGAGVLAFVFGGKPPRSAEPLKTELPEQATTATHSSFEQHIPAPERTVTKTAPPQTPSPEVAHPAATPKPPPPIPQAIYATKEAARSEYYLPYGRLLRCELVNAVESTNIETPIIGLITDDVWQAGRLVIPAGTEVHGLAQKTAARERIGSERQWVLVFQDGKELPLSGTVLDYAPEGANGEQWAETDGSAGLRGYMIAADKYAEAKAILAAMISAGAGAFPSMTNIISPLTGGVTQVQQGGYQDAIAAGIQAGGQIYSQRLLEGLNDEPYYVRVPAGTTFYLYVSQTVDLVNARISSSTQSTK